MDAGRSGRSDPFPGRAGLLSVAHRVPLAVRNFPEFQRGRIEHVAVIRLHVAEALKFLREIPEKFGLDAPRFRANPRQIYVDRLG